MPSRGQMLSTGLQKPYVPEPEQTGGLAARRLKFAVARVFYKFRIVAVAAVPVAFGPAAAFQQSSAPEKAFTQSADAKKVWPP